MIEKQQLSKIIIFCRPILQVIISYNYLHLASRHLKLRVNFVISMSQNFLVLQHHQDTGQLAINNSAADDPLLEPTSAFTFKTLC